MYQDKTDANAMLRDKTLPEHTTLPDPGSDGLQGSEARGSFGISKSAPARNVLLRVGSPRTQLAALLCAASVALCLTSLVRAGGGDEGVEILPALLGRAPQGPTGSDVITTNISVNNQDFFELCYVEPYGPGMVLSQHAMADVVPINQLPQHVNPALQVLVKHPKVLTLADESGDLLLGGRYVVEDHTLAGDTPIQLRLQGNRVHLLMILVGRRSSSTGEIPRSFHDVEWRFAQLVPTGIVDLAALRHEARSVLPRGTGLEVAVGLLTRGDSGSFVEAWAAFALDDGLPIFDVDTPH